MRPSFLGNRVRICDVCGEEAKGNFSLDPAIHFTCSRCVQRRLMTREKNQEINLEEVKEAIRAKKLRHYRQSKGWTLRDLARRLKVSYGYLGKLENNRQKPTEEWLNGLKANQERWAKNSHG